MTVGVNLKRVGPVGDVRMIALGGCLLYCATAVSLAWTYHHLPEVQSPGHGQSPSSTPSKAIQGALGRLGCRFETFEPEPWQIYRIAAGHEKGGCHILS